ncbi:MAG: RHS repeat-associated core domain-containing protein [Bacteroidales bacterium]
MKIHYHSDHLGSASFVTNAEGAVIQHLQYLPYGELFVSQRNSEKFDSRYKFTAKELDNETSYTYFGARYYDSELSGWLSVDPMSDKYPSLSPYCYTANNPVVLVDPNGANISEFDENGNYLGTKKDNWFHNTFFGRTGRIVDSDGNVTQKFKFADPKNDVNDLINGKINKIHFVQEEEIISMLSRAGAFNQENKTASNDLFNRYDYIGEEGKGGGKFDFATTEEWGLKYQYPNITKEQTLFLVDGVAHNDMNFGNFLFGAAGKAIGFTLPELLMGAHYNSLFNSNTNGYKPQIDSRDDQLSICMGVLHANKYKYKDMYYRVEVHPLIKN